MSNLQAIFDDATSYQEYAKTQKNKERKNKNQGNNIKIRLLLNEDSSITSSVCMYVWGFIES